MFSIFEMLCFLKLQYLLWALMSTDFYVLKPSAAVEQFDWVDLSWRRHCLVKHFSAADNSGGYILKPWPNGIIEYEQHNILVKQYLFWDKPSYHIHQNNKLPSVTTRGMVFPYSSFPFTKNHGCFWNINILIIIILRTLFVGPAAIRAASKIAEQVRVERSPPPATVSTSKPGTSQLSAAGGTVSKAKLTITKDDNQSSSSPPPLKKNKSLFCSIFCWHFVDYREEKWTEGLSGK